MDKIMFNKKNEKMVNMIVDEYIDNNINASHPYEERANGDVIILSKYDLGRQIVVENFDIDGLDTAVDYDKLYDLVEDFMNDIICGILNGAIT